MTKQVIILFDSTHEPLGECSVEGGMCSSVRLNERGEHLLGRVLEKLASQKMERLMPFQDILREWADHSGMLLVSIPSDRVSVWQQITSMPISSADRYALAFAISHSSKRQQEVWSEILKQSVNS